MALFSSQGELFDGEVEPEGEGQAIPEALRAVGEERSGIAGEVKARCDRDPIDTERDQGGNGDDEGEAEREFDAVDV